MTWFGDIGRRFTLKSVSTTQFKLPQRFRGTIIEKWANYWKNLCIDYKEVVVETAQNAREKPVKAVLILSGFGFMGYCAHSNPDARSFRDKLLYCTNQMIMVGEQIRNPSSVSHLIFLENCYNKGVIRRLSLGVVSFMWISDYDEASGLYQAHCDYLGPKYLTFHQRIVDVGFLWRWWLLQKAMTDYDINPLEFENSDQTSS
ncbi:hypothetical protein ANN_16187 [Periplaneta americana]|uniref:Uncharacterized protein n=1 Tax=Periplaneta americana TaxID=6978 RepID=A0ABQ8SIB3_PERAM|nr:hypothetical protein ANN_16187 [Periplaneta americana]